MDVGRLLLFRSLHGLGQEASVGAAYVEARTAALAEIEHMHVAGLFDPREHRDGARRYELLRRFAILCPVGIGAGRRQRVLNGDLAGNAFGRDSAGVAHVDQRRFDRGRDHRAADRDG